MLLVVMYLKPLLSLTLRNSINKRAGIAQLVERNLAKVEVASSNLVSRSTSLMTESLCLKGMYMIWLS